MSRIIFSTFGGYCDITIIFKTKEQLVSNIVGIVIVKGDVVKAMQKRFVDHIISFNSEVNSPISINELLRELESIAVTYLYADTNGTLDECYNSFVKFYPVYICHKDHPY